MLGRAEIQVNLLRYSLPSGCEEAGRIISSLRACGSTQHAEPCDTAIQSSFLGFDSESLLGNFLLRPRVPVLRFVL